MRNLPKTNLPGVLWKAWANGYIAQQIIVLGVPIIIGQLGAIAQQFADTMMVGQFSTSHLAAGGFVNNLFNPVIYFMLGISYAATPVTGAAFGKKDNGATARSLAEGIMVNVAVSMVVALILLLLYFNIGVFDQPQEIIPIALPYFLILIASVPFLAAFNALKQFSDAIGQTRMPMWIMLAANAVNIVLNYVLIFGIDLHMGQMAVQIASWGLTGAGIATLISRIFAVAALAWVFCRHGSYAFLKENLSLRISRSSVAGMWRFLRLGLPISVQLMLEASSFNVCAIFMGWLGTVPLAAHQVMCTISTLCFQVVYGTGAAASVMISQFRGAGDWFNVRRTAYTSLGIGALLIVAMNSLVYVMRFPLMGCFTTSSEVVATIMTILPCFFLYQAGDCMQITFANALRGIEQVRHMMLSAFIAYVCVSIPLSYVFGFVLNYGSAGVWMGMPFGLTTAGILFWREFHVKSKR